MLHNATMIRHMRGERLGRDLTICDSLELLLLLTALVTCLDPTSWTILVGYSTSSGSHPSLSRALRGWVPAKPSLDRPSRRTSTLSNPPLVANSAATGKFALECSAFIESLTSPVLNHHPNRLAARYCKRWRPEVAPRLGRETYRFQGCLNERAPAYEVVGA